MRHARGYANRATVILALPLALLFVTACSNRSSESTASAGAQHESAESRAAAKQPDNTAVNARDRDGRALTATDHSENPADRDLTARLRQQVVSDDSLSTTAKNVKIITNAGVVTLRGPVNSEQEKQAIAAKAKQVAGVQRVDNQLEVAAQ